MTSLLDLKRIVKKLEKGSKGTRPSSVEVEFWLIEDTKDKYGDPTERFLELDCVRQFSVMPDASFRFKVSR
jgi:hypothetical protein